MICAFNAGMPGNGWRAIATGCDDNAELISSAHNLGQF
jgi:hypothetical protein